MKTILIAFLLLGSLVSGFSQTQEVKLVDRIMKPDLELGNPLQSKSFSGTSSVKLKRDSSATQGFYGVKDAYTKDFPYTRSFLGLKNPWFGGKVFDTKGTSSQSKFDTKKFYGDSKKSTDVTGYHAAAKTADFGSPVVPASTFVPSPSSQGALSRIKDKINEKMTIDEVRELLNKSR